jgi:hypothetical protein
LARQTVCLSFLLVCLPLSAQLRVTATFEGRALADAEVCVYDLEPADPRVGLLAPELRCFPAGEVLALPAKTYGWLVRHRDRLITPDHGMVTGTGTTGGEAIERKVALAGGAHLDISGIVLGEGEHLALITGPTSQNRGATAPLAVSGGRALVPAETPVTLVRIRAGEPVWVSETMRLADGVTQVPRTADGSAALAWFRSDDPALPSASGARKLTHSPEYLKLLMKQELPVVELVDAKGKIHRADMAADNVAQWIDSIYVFHGAAPGPGVLRVRGGRFLPRDMKIELKATAPLLIEDAVQLEMGGEIAATLRVQHWLAPSGPLPPCRLPPPRTEPKAVLLLEACENQTCRKLEERPVDRTAPDGDVTFAQLAPGEYRLTLRDSRLGSVTQAVAVRRGETSSVPLDLDHVTISGTVRVGESALPADISFVTGSATTDLNGTYVALLPKAPGLETVTVLPCDGSPEYTVTYDDVTWY